MFSAWETFAKKRYEQGRRDEREKWAKVTAPLEKECEERAMHLAELEIEIADRDLMTRIVDLLKQEVSEPKRLVKRVSEMERLTKERDQ